MNTKGELPDCRLGREAGGQQPELERGHLGPRDGILYQIVSRLPVANQVFLGSWMVDIRQEGRSQRSALQRRYMAHLRQHSHYEPRKPSGWNQGGDKAHRQAGKSVLAQHLVT